MEHLRTTAVLVLTLLAPVAIAAQERGWVAEATIGYAGFVDDATRPFLVTGGSVRRYVTPRLSIGPELVIMTGWGSTRQDRNVMLTGNVVFDAAQNGNDSHRVTPFIVGGLGKFWSRTQVGTGPFSSSDPAFTAGAGLRARLSDRVSANGEYRIGWELHQRVTGSVGVRW